MSQFRAACFTLNNPNTEELENLHALLKDFKYAVYQLERGEQGTVHVQGYAVSAKPKRRCRPINQFQQVIRKTPLPVYAGQAIRLQRRQEHQYVELVFFSHGYPPVLRVRLWLLLCLGLILQKLS